MKLPQFKASDVKNKLEVKLQIQFNNGKELNGYIKVDNNKKKRITIPHGRKEIPKGTLNSIINQLGLTKEDFYSFMKCDFGYIEYLEKI